MRQDLRQTLELGAGGGTVAILTLIYVLGVARFLGPADYADFSVALAIFYFVAVAISPLAPTIARLVARHVSRGESQKVAALQRELLRRVLRWSAFAAIPLLAAVVPLARVFHFESPYPIAIALLSSAIFTFVSIRRGVLQGLGRFGAHNLNTVLEAAVRIVAALGIMVYLPTPTGALLAYLFALFAATALLPPEGAAPSEETPDWSGVRQLLWPMFIAMAGIAVFQNADVLVVKRWFPAADAGRYSAASTLARSVSVLLVPIYTLAGPMLTALHERRESLLPQTARLCSYFLGMAAAPIVIFAIAGDRVIVLLYGEAFRSAGVLLWPLAGIGVLTYLSLIIGQALITVGDRRFGTIYLTFTVAQISALIVARGEIDTIILAQYVVQGALLAVMVIVMMRWRTGNRTC